jgi:putative Holliday junction resolvase
VRQAFNNQQAQSGTVLAFDFGTKRVGVAVGDLAHGIAHPLSTIAFEDNRRRLDAIATLIAEWQPVRLIVGAPGGTGKGDHPLCAHIGRFVRRLSARFDIKVDVIDETLTSWAASRRLSQVGRRAESQKHVVDAMAACVILETWFEDRRADVTLPDNER